MTDLCKLAQLYGTDKFPWYTPFYDALLRQHNAFKILEIGIGTPSTMGHVPDYKPGASLRMWRDYFPCAEVWGVDIDPAVMFHEERINTFCIDQADTLSLAAISQGRQYDLIIDDGSHDPAHQILSATTLVPYLSPGGLYIIEDVNGTLDIPFVHQVVECHVAGSPKVGRLILIQGEK